MPTTTTNLGLTLPGLGEFTDDWFEPINGNFVLIDTAVGALTTEIVAARQGATDLFSYLSVGINTDGTLKPATEVVAARSSPVYGVRDGSGNLIPLKTRLDDMDFEVLKARYGQAALIDGLALLQPGLKDAVLAGAVNVNGYSTWLNPSTNKAVADGSTTVVSLLIGGYAARIRTAKSVTISGGAATYYIYATYQAGGVVTVNGDSSNPPPSTPTGQTSLDGNGDMTFFTDTTVNFLTSDVAAGDILTLLTSNDAGTYVVSQVAPGGNQNRLQIIGVFPVGGLSAINYTVRDPLAVTLGFTATPTVVAGRAYIGEADFDGSSVTATRARSLRNTFIGAYQHYNLVSTATSEVIWPHNLGSDLLDVEVQVSQANDGSQPVELLSVSDLSSTLGVSVTDTTALTLPTINASSLSFNAGSSGASLTGSVSGSLSGTVTAALTGDVKPVRSVAVKWDRNNIYVKNVTPNLLYKDYSGAQQQQGYVRVVVRKRG